MTDKYILNEAGEPQRAPSLLEWGKWFEENPDQKVVERTDFDDGYVSTVFLALDHGFGEGLPILWETMVFGGQHDGFCKRYTSRESAEKGHARIVENLGSDDLDETL